MARQRGRWTNCLLLAAFALNGCGANWRPVGTAETRTFNPATVLEFHSRDQLVRLHGVRFERDSVSGIPWLEHLSCDSCRVHYALADISQARIGDPGRTAWGIVLPVVAVFTLFQLLHFLVCGGFGECT
jgi:hypothetical protein